MKASHDKVVVRRGMVLRLSAVAVGVAIALTGCSAGGSTGGSSSTAKPQAAPVPLAVIQSVGQDFSTGGVDFADVNKTWPKSITVTNSASPNVAQALATGDAQIGITSPTRVMGAILQGLDVTIVGPGEKDWDQQVVARKGITSLAGLKGAKFGITTFGSAGQFSVQAIAKKEGWKTSDYSLVTLGTIDALTAALKAGQIDAFTWGAFAPFQLQQAGTANLLGYVSNLIGEMPTSVIAVNNDTIKNHPAAVKAFCSAYYASNKWIIKNPGKAATQYTAWGEDAGAVPPAVKAYAPMLATGPAITNKGWSNIITATLLTDPTATFLTVPGIKKYYTSCDSI
jgi:ABC-type amino acid transport substrate-binding protein